MVVKTLCPICKQTLAANIYSDRSVGINFDFEVVNEETNCMCDVDDDIIAELQYEKLSREFYHLV